MTVKALDHVNILTADLEGSARFYAAVLGLDRRDPPEPLPPAAIQWLHDAAGQPVVHLVSAAMDHPEVAARKARAGTATGSIDHVAFACEGLDAMIERLERLGITYRRSEVSGISLTQLFVKDPNQVLLELNFRGD